MDNFDPEFEEKITRVLERMPPRDRAVLSEALQIGPPNAGAKFASDPAAPIENRVEETPGKSAAPAVHLRKKTGKNPTPLNRSEALKSRIREEANRFEFTSLINENGQNQASFLAIQEPVEAASIQRALEEGSARILAEQTPDAPILGIIVANGSHDPKRVEPSKLAAQRERIAVVSAASSSDSRREFRRIIGAASIVLVTALAGLEIYRLSARPAALSSNSASGTARFLDSEAISEKTLLADSAHNSPPTGAAKTAQSAAFNAPKPSAKDARFDVPKGPVLVNIAAEPTRERRMRATRRPDRVRRVQARVTAHPAGGHSGHKASDSGFDHGVNTLLNHLP